MFKHMPTPLPTLAEATAAAASVQKANEDVADAQTVEAAPAAVQAASEDAEAVEARAGQKSGKSWIQQPTFNLCAHLHLHLIN